MCMYISWIWLVNFIDWKKFTIHFTITWKRTENVNIHESLLKKIRIVKKRICPNDCSAYKKAKQFKIKENYSTYSYKFSFVLFSLFSDNLYKKQALQVKKNSNKKKTWQNSVEHDAIWKMKEKERSL